jgi:hypothetical protein
MNNKFEDGLYVHYDKNDGYRYPEVCVYGGYSVDERDGKEYIYHHFDDPTRPGVQTVTTVSDWHGKRSDIFKFEEVNFHYMYNDVTRMRREYIIEHCRDLDIVALVTLVDGMDLVELHHAFHNVYRHGGLEDKHYAKVDGEMVLVDGARDE